jgi:uncharacterized protein YjbI with pentapeptide repeats
VQLRRLIVPALVLLLGVGVMSIAMVVVPEWIVGAVEIADPIKRLELENSVRGVVVPGLAGTLFLATAYLTWRQVEATSQQVDAAQRGLQLAQEQLALNARANVSERFVRAVDLLGAEQITARVGGVYALESIATDESTYHRTVQELLASSAREHAPSELALAAQQIAGASTADVRAMLRVLARPPMNVPDDNCRREALSQRSYTCGACGAGTHEGEGADRANLSGIVLERIDLANGCLDRAGLRGATLDHCDLRQASLVHADLRRALVRKSDLEGANLMWTDLTDSVFRRCNLRKLELRNAELENARLEWCDLTWTHFREWDAYALSLRGSKLSHTVFGGNGSIFRSDFRQVWGDPDFSGLRLDRCDFSRATLFRGTEFNRTNLLSCLFEGTEFWDVDFSNAWLHGCIFKEGQMQVTFINTVFRGVDFTGTSFNDPYIADFEGCYADRGTAWPSGYEERGPLGVEICEEGDPRLRRPQRDAPPVEWPDRRTLPTT